MSLDVAAIQMGSEPLAVEDNLDRADHYLLEAHRSGVGLAVLPEMFNTGYGAQPDYSPYAEDIEGPTLDHLSERSREWGMMIAAGFVEHDGRHIYDSLALVLPDGSRHVYRKRHLVFWEGFRFHPGDRPTVVKTPYGRIGLAICADMIYRGVWEGYRHHIDLAVISSAWPDFADRESGRKHWLFGHIGPYAGIIPGRVAHDLGVPVIFANQCGETSTMIPIMRKRILDRFAGMSSICDGLRSEPVVAGIEEALLIGNVSPAGRGGATLCFTSRSGQEAPSSGSEPGSPVASAGASIGTRAVDVA